VLCAGTIESAKIALQSNLADPNNKIGKGLTDHTIMYRHFIIPPAYWTDNGVTVAGAESAKFVIADPAASLQQHAFDIVLELGAPFNQAVMSTPIIWSTTRTFQPVGCSARSSFSSTPRSKTAIPLR
jgi:hypothetical protein